MRNYSVCALLIGLMLISSAHADETWKKEPYAYETWRSDSGEVVAKDRYGYETYRSNTGEVCKTDRYGGAVHCTH